MAAPDPTRFDLDGGLTSPAAAPLAPPHTIPVCPEIATVLPAALAVPVQEQIIVNAPGPLNVLGQPMLDFLLNFQFPYAREPDVEPPVNEDDDEILTDESEESADESEVSADESEEEEDRLAPLVPQDQMANAAAAPGQEVASAPQFEGLLDCCPETKRRRTDEQGHRLPITEPGFCVNNASAAGPWTTAGEIPCVFNTIDPRPTEEPVPPTPEVEDHLTREMLLETLTKQFYPSFSPTSASTDSSVSAEAGIEPALDPLHWKGKAKVVESP